MVLEIDAKVTDGGFPEKLIQKSGAIAPRFIKDTNSMLLSIENDVKFFIPRGQHCPGQGKGGTTKSAVKHRLTGQGGEVYADEGTAPWFDWFEEGRGVVRVKKAKALHFCIKGQHIFTKKTGPSKGADSFKKGARQAEPKVQRKAEEMGRWLERL